MSAEEFEFSEAELENQTGRKAQDSHPFREGELARREGRALDSNQYAPRSWQSTRFIEGYKLQDRKMSNSAKETQSMSTEEATVKKQSRKKKETASGDGKEPKRARGKAGKTGELFDLSDKKDKALIDQAEHVKDCETNRMEWGKKETEGRALLLEMMRKREKTFYKYEDMEIKIEPGAEKVKVRKQKDDEEEE